MERSVQIIPARPEHIEPIARRMRQADRDEVFAASGKTATEALEYSLEKSAHSWTAIVDGVPEAMFGVGDLNILAGVGAPWLLGTDAVEENVKLFLRLSRDFKAQLLSRYPVLRNFVDDRNTASVRWLRWLGASMSDPVDIRGYQFRLFELRAE